MTAEEWAEKYFDESPWEDDFQESREDQIERLSRTIREAIAEHASRPQQSQPKRPPEGSER